MPKISLTAKGSFAKVDRFIDRMSRAEMFSRLEAFGKEGVAALASATPRDSSVTANSWSYKVTKSLRGATIEWTNSNIVNGVPIAVILQYGHGTGTGGYVEGRDYINPAMRSVFDRIANDAWKVVTTA